MEEREVRIGGPPTAHIDHRYAFDAPFLKIVGPGWSPPEEVMGL